MDNLKIDIQSNLLGNAYAVFLTCSMLAQNYYLDKGFIAVTSGFLGEPLLIGLPNLDLNKVKNFWDIAKKYDYNHLPTPDDASILGLLQILEETDNKISLEDSKEFIQNIKIKLFNYLVSLFPEIKNSKTKITIYITNYGSLCSFLYPLKQVDGEFQGYIFLRKDTSPAHLLEGVFSCLAGQALDEKYSWHQRESIIDFLCESFLDYAGIRKHGFKTTTKIIKGEVSLESIYNYFKFLKDNRLQLKTLLKIKSEVIEVFNNEVSDIFSTKEMRILKAFIDAPYHSLSYDNLASIIWESNEDFSLWAINKTIERIRKKLISEGLPKTIIRTIRNYGYCLL
jgi:hypothetical protein